MKSCGLPSQSAPTKRATESDIERQSSYFHNDPFLKSMFDTVPNIFLVLNKERQIVFCNRALLDFLGLQRTQDVYGRRPGEVLKCIHVVDSEGDCGTTEFCRTCGGMSAFLSSQSGTRDVRECQITRKQDEMLESLDLRVWCSPLTIHGEPFTTYAVNDISHEKRRSALERIFFHDILNTAGAIRGFAQVLKDTIPEMTGDFVETIIDGSNRLIMEILAQKDLVAAENNQLSIETVQLSSLEFLKQTAALCMNHGAAKACRLLIDEGAENVSFETDPVLLGRVMTNMIKNALEASQEGETVTLGCKEIDRKVKLWVHNPAHMAREVQLQIFNRSFSTKGRNRGLGTYSIRLLSERYLKGKVAFKSSSEEGTTFCGIYPLKLS